MFKLPIQIKEGISDYDRSIKDFIAGKLTWARFAGTRVPWGNYSHRGGKIFMARIRIPAGVLKPEQLKALAYCAKNYGNGVLHITTRQDIQLHEVKIENIIKIHQYLKDYELSSRGGGGNTVRNITVCPLSGICCDEVFDTGEEVVSLTEYLLGIEASYNLPRKFKISFSGCSLDCAGALLNDVGLVSVKKQEIPGYRVYVGGGMGAKPALGALLEDFILRQDLGYAVRAIENTFYKYGDRKNKHHNRLRFLLQDIGLEKFKEYYRDELKNVKENELIVLRKNSLGTGLDKPLSGTGPYRDLSPHTSGSVPPKDADFEKFLQYNNFGQKQKGFALVKLRIPRGDLAAEDAVKLADLGNEFKQIEFRASQQQNLYAANIPEQDLSKFYQRIKTILNDFLYPQTLLDVVACKGSLTCNLGLCNSPGLAKEIETFIARDFLDTKVFDKLDLKINGCPNACGRHPTGLVAFHGVARKVGDRPVPLYRLLLGGRIGSEKTRLAKDTGILIPAKNVPGFLKDFLKQIEAEINERTDLSQYILEKGELIARKISEKYSYVPSYQENRDIYIDWGKETEFSLEGLGPGECGAGVLDMIDSDLIEAKIALEEAEKKNFSPAFIRKAIFLSARALLVVKGADPKNEDEAIINFIEKFVREGIASDKYRSLKEVFAGIQEKLPPEEGKEKFLYAKGLYEHINQLYKLMDSSFNFPKLQETEKEKALNFLDLKGTPCPINYVKAKLFLENFKIGDIIEILLDAGEPIENVPKSLEADGHKILKIEKLDGFYKVVVKKGN